MNYANLTSPRCLSRRVRRPFGHSVIDDIKDTVSRVELSTSSLIAISAAASVGAGMAYYFLHKRNHQTEHNSANPDSYPDSPREHR